MSKTVETYELLVPIVQTISPQFRGDSITNNGNGTYTYTTCDTLWLTKGHEVTINSVVYKVVDIDPNVSVTLSGASVPTDLIFNIYSPYFVHGTILQQAEEYNRESNFANKLPIIYLQEITRERINDDEQLSRDRDSDCTIFFMVNYSNDWKINDHYKYAIRPMRNLIGRFISALKVAKIVDNEDLKSHDIYDHAKLGSYVITKGHTAKFFQDDLSGSELRITIPFLKQSEGCCNAGVPDVCASGIVKDQNGNIIGEVPSGGETTINTGAPVRIVNSNATYDEQQAAGTTHNLPNVTHTDSDGSPEILPAMTPMVCTPSKNLTDYTCNELNAGLTQSQKDCIVSDSLISSNLYIDINPELGVTLNSGNVSQINDQSGNAHHFLQATDVNQPLYVANGINSLHTIRFDGVDDFLLNSTVSLPQTNVIIYIVWKPITWVDARYILYGREDGVGNALSFFQNTVNLRTSLNYTNGSTSDMNYPLNSFYITTLIDNTTNNIQCKDISEITTASKTPVLRTANRFSIGAPYILPALACNFELARMLFYTVVHTPSERLQTINYLNSIYNVI